MKLYVHYEDHTRADAWTKRVALTPALATLDDVLRVFCASYSRKFSAAHGGEAAALAPADVDVFTERNQESATRKPFEDDKHAQKWFAQWGMHARGDCDFELIVVRKPAVVRGKKPGNKVVQEQVAQSSSVPSPPTASRSPHMENISLCTDADSVDNKQKKDKQAQLEELQVVLDLGASLMQQVKYRSAKQLFETMVLAVDPDNAQALIAMGDIHAASHRYDVAINTWYKKCWDARSDSKDDRDKKQVKLVFECGLKIVRCEIRRENYREALSMIEKLQQSLRHESKPKVKCASLTVEKEDMEAQMDFLKAQALYGMHALSSSPELQDPAIALLTHLLPDLQDPQVNLDALLLYSRIAFDRGKKSEALSMALRVLVSRPDDRAVKRQLAAFLKDSSGAEMLQQVLPSEGGASSAAAYAFIGTVLKDFGALESSVTCFERAMVDNPESPGYALNHAHVLEACNRHESALGVLTAFFKQNSSFSVGGTLTAGEILQALDAVASLPLPTQQSSDLHDPQRREQWRVEWVATKEAGYASVYLNGSLVTAPTTQSKGDQKRPSVRQLPEEDELDLLACFFTVVKVGASLHSLIALRDPTAHRCVSYGKTTQILFLAGRVSEIPRLISLIEPVRVGKALHRTVIRNEQAYYSCIAQLLSVEENFLPPSSSSSSAAASEPRHQSSVPASTIYVCGDSHTLATAWREIQVHGQPTILHPALVTGLKHWHLRKDSVFYPKLNFWKVLAGIPRRSKVVFLFGEIDCREGILLAVERCKYESIEEGMEATIRIFMLALDEAVRKFELEAFIHPVVPVLNETRQLVIQYNKIVKMRVLKSKICKWLDFFDDLVHDSPEKLRPELVLDGTHLHPRYICSLERALNDLE